MIEKIKLTDNTNTKKYFTMLPNYILNHSSAVDQALYIQMIRYAGDNNCWASKRTFMKQLKVGMKSINKSIDYLISHGWIKNLGKKEVITKGGTQLVDEYEIVDIWKQNLDYYQGASESTPLEDQGASESSSRCIQKEGQGVSKSTPINNHTKKEQNKEDSLLSLFHKEIKTEDLEEVKKFIDYWTEKNIKGTKEKWQMEKTFDVKRRWAKWNDNILTWKLKGRTEDTTNKVPYYSGMIAQKVREEWTDKEGKKHIWIGFIFMNDGRKIHIKKEDEKYIQYK